MNAENYVDEAEKVIKKLESRLDRNGRKIQMVTTSKLRDLLAMTADIYNEVMNLNDDTLTESICERIEYLRVRIIYDSGREPAVKSFVEETHLLDEIKKIQKSRKNYILFNRYMEALVAYRKFYGKDE